MQVFMRLHAFALTGFSNPLNSKTSTLNAATFVPSMDGEETAAGGTSSVHLRASRHGARTSVEEEEDKDR